MLLANLPDDILSETSERKPAALFLQLLTSLEFYTKPLYRSRLAMLQVEPDLAQRALHAIEEAMALEHRRLERTYHFSLLEELVVILEENNSLYKQLGPFYVKSIINMLNRSLLQVSNVFFTSRR